MVPLILVCHAVPRGREADADAVRRENGDRTGDPALQVPENGLRGFYVAASGARAKYDMHGEV